MDRRKEVVRRTLVLLLVFCLVECTTGSCLSYGHSCWGAHGKRSGKTQLSPAADWYFQHLLRKLASNSDSMESVKRPQNVNGDLAAIFRANPANYLKSSEKTDDNSGPWRASEYLALEKPVPDIAPMLDDDLLTKTNIWKLMRAAAAIRKQ